jgi:hypothetical protein
LPHLPNISNILSDVKPFGQIPNIPGSQRPLTQISRVTPCLIFFRNLPSHTLRYLKLIRFQNSACMITGKALSSISHVQITRIVKHSLVGTLVSHTRPRFTSSGQYILGPPETRDFLLTVFVAPAQQSSADNSPIF